MSTKKKPAPIRVEPDPNEPMPKRFLDKEIAALGDAARRLLASGLDRDDLTALITRRCRNLGFKDVAAVLDAIDRLGSRYAQS